MTCPRVHITTLGCKVNQCDGHEIAQALAARGCRIVTRGDAADVYIVNTCTVTATADAKARKLIRKLAREHPGARLIVTGCLAQRDPDSLARLPGVSAVLPNSQKPYLANLLPLLPSHLSPLPSPPSRTRSFLKVQDGCDHRCAYCAVPDARGRPISKPMEEVLQEVGRFAAAGVQEVVLCGIRLGAYGRDRGQGSLTALLRELRDIGIPRLRLSSLEPMDVDEPLIEEIADHPRLCHHLPLPLQSGDDNVLAAMGRGYTTADYRHLVRRLRDAWPDVAVTTDVMVAFPGETDEQFQRTVHFAREMTFSRVHVFPYSSRPGTPAAACGNRVPTHIASQRTQHMLAVARHLARQAARVWVGETVSVLFEQRRRDGLLTGLTEHYLRVRCPGPAEWVGIIAELVPDAHEEGDLIVEAQPPRSAARPRE